MIGNKIIIYGKGIEELERIRLKMYDSKFRMKTKRELAFEPLLPKRTPIEFYGLMKNRNFYLPYERIDNYKKVTATFILERNNGKGYNMSYTGTGISFRLNTDMSWKISMYIIGDEKEAIADLTQ